MFKARTGTYNLEIDKERWGTSDGFCKLCTLSLKDTLLHRLLVCPHFGNERITFYLNILKKCEPMSSATFIHSDSNSKLSLMLGEKGFSLWGHDEGFKFLSCVKAYLKATYISQIE